MGNGLLKNWILFGNSAKLTVFLYSTRTEFLDNFTISIILAHILSLIMQISVNLNATIIPKKVQRDIKQIPPYYTPSPFNEIIQQLPAITST